MLSTRVINVVLCVEVGNHLLEQLLVDAGTILHLNQAFTALTAGAAGGLDRSVELSARAGVDNSRQLIKLQPFPVLRYQFPEVVRRLRPSSLLIE